MHVLTRRYTSLTGIDTDECGIFRRWLEVYVGEPQKPEQLSQSRGTIQTNDNLKKEAGNGGTNKEEDNKVNSELITTMA